MVLIKLKKKTLITSQLIFYCFEKEWLYKIRYWLINNLNLNLGESNRTGFQDISYSLNNKYYKKKSNPMTLWVIFGIKKDVSREKFWRTLSENIWKCYILNNFLIFNIGIPIRKLRQWLDCLNNVLLFLFLTYIFYKIL